MNLLHNRYNYYDILEIDSHCPQHEITAAYERARRTYSGDDPAIYTMFSETEARDLLRLVEEAYSVLGNKTLRSLYDEKIGQRRSDAELTFAALQAEGRTVFNSTLSLVKKQSMFDRPGFTKDESFEAEIKSTLSWDGTLLKRVREYKKHSHESMNELTKISIFYLNALESMDASSLPAPVFVRGYILQIAKVLGLDERKVCDSYMRLYKVSLEKAN